MSRIWRTQTGVALSWFVKYVVPPPEEQTAFQTGKVSPVKDDPTTSGGGDEVIVTSGARLQ